MSAFKHPISALSDVRSYLTDAIDQREAFCRAVFVAARTSTDAVTKVERDDCARYIREVATLKETLRTLTKERLP